jgi:hypothetical protein
VLKDGAGVLEHFDGFGEELEPYVRFVYQPGGAERDPERARRAEGAGEGDLRSAELC